MQPKLKIPGIMLGLTFLCTSSLAQSLGSAGTIEGTVTDPTGAVVSGASVEIQNAVSGFRRVIATDESGNFRLTNIPPNPYHIHVFAGGFKEVHQDVTLRSSVPVSLKIQLESVPPGKLRAAAFIALMA